MVLELCQLFSRGNTTLNCSVYVPMAARSKALVCGRSPAEIMGSNPTGGMDVCVVSVMCCHVEVSATS